MVWIKSLVTGHKQMGIRPRNNEKIECLRWDPISECFPSTEFRIQTLNQSTDFISFTDSISFTDFIFFTDFISSTDSIP